MPISVFLFLQSYYFHSLCNFFPGIASICYWYNPTSTLFHTIDVITSRTCTLIYFGTTLYYAYHTSIEHIISTLLLSTQVVFFYAKSRNTYFNHDSSWIVYHVGFHISCFMATIFSYFLLN
jgi:hypothetical protein